MTVRRTIPTIRHRSVDVDGVRVAYRESGPADGPVLLLLHGFPTASHQFARLMDALGDTPHRLARQMREEKKRAQGTWIDVRPPPPHRPPPPGRRGGAARRPPRGGPARGPRPPAPDGLPTRAPPVRPPHGRPR